MMLSRLIFPFILWISVANGLLIRPSRKCVPTAAVHAPCHQCVCSTVGVYHCWHKKCDNNETETTQFDKECEPSLIYIERGLICSCSTMGYWRSTNCRNHFRRIQTKHALTNEVLRTHIGCTPYKLYLIECNICRCEPNGILKPSSCTSRPCAAKNKAGTCRAGDIERFGNELCACSDINYFIDRLCFRINEEEMQVVENRNLEKLVYADQPWRRTFAENYRCNQHITFTINCNTCVCKKGGLECTKNVCGTDIYNARSRKKVVKIIPELKSANEKCEPGKKYRFKCNTCVCADDGVPTCTKMICLEDFLLDLYSLRGALKTATNISNIARTMPEITEGQTCIPGDKYKMDCNTCICKNDGNLMCTKLLCVPIKRSDGRKNNNDIILNIKSNVTVKKVTPKKGLRMLLRIPVLPETCVPGKIYRNGCQTCFCEDNKKGVCTEKKNPCKEYKKGVMFRYLQDIRPPFQPEEVENLPKLSQRHVKCQPGKSYRVDCNSCVCLDSHDLICDDLICLSYDDMHRIEADEKSRGVCRPHTYSKTVEDCIECDCVKNKVKCSEIMGCISERDKKLPNWNDGKPKLTLDMFKETCIPGGVYTMHCNNCYCQDDSTLRCTLKTCLNYSQAKALEEQRIYIIQHEL